MSWLRAFFQRMFTFAPLQRMSLEQAEAVTALLTVALYADGEPNAEELAEFESALFGVPHAWTQEAVLRTHIQAVRQTIGHVGHEAAIPPVERLGMLPRDYLLVSAVLVADDGIDGLTETERQIFQRMAVLLEVSAAVTARILADPRAYLDAEW